MFDHKIIAQKNNHEPSFYKVGTVPGELLRQAFPKLDTVIRKIFRNPKKDPDNYILRSYSVRDRKKYVALIEKRVISLEQQQRLIGLIKTVHDWGKNGEVDTGTYILQMRNIFQNEMVDSTSIPKGIQNVRTPNKDPGITEEEMSELDKIMPEIDAVDDFIAAIRSEDSARVSLQDLLIINKLLNKAIKKYPVSATKHSRSKLDDLRTAFETEDFSWIDVGRLRDVVDPLITEKLQSLLDMSYEQLARIKYTTLNDIVHYITDNYCDVTPSGEMLKNLPFVNAHQLIRSINETLDIYARDFILD